MCGRLLGMSLVSYNIIKSISILLSYYHHYFPIDPHNKWSVFCSSYISFYGHFYIYLNYRDMIF